MSVNSDSDNNNNSNGNNDEREIKTESDRKETVDVNDIIYTSIYDANNRSIDSPLTNAFNHDLRVGFLFSLIYLFKKKMISKI
jgi:hypothetical protein